MTEREISPEQAEALARTVGLHLGPERARELARQLQALLRGVDRLESLGLEGAEPEVTFVPRS